MPTDAHQDILYRELAVVQTRELFPRASPLLREIVNFATNAFVRCMSYAEGEKNVHLAPFSLHRHILELTDAIEVLVSNGCPSACQSNLRSSFEALLSLEYITEPGSDYRLRSLSWLAAYARDHLGTYRSLSTSSPQGQRFLAAIQDDNAVREFPPLPQDEIAKGIERMERLLARDQFTEILQEFAKATREPHWYSLFGGPTNLRELAEHLHRPAQYQVLYRQWSLAAHALDFFPFIAPATDGEKAVRGLRDVASTNEVTTYAAIFLIDASRLLINKFHPGETWGDWYKREVRRDFLETAKSTRRCV
jgi:hypothetical protein